MHSELPYFPQKPMLPLRDQVGLYMQNASVAPVINQVSVPPCIDSLVPLSHGVDIQPSDACPKNFIIFDQTNNKSHVMFHPEMAAKMYYPGFHVDTSIFRYNVNENDVNNEGKFDSLKEDSADIDALLSTEDEENYESDGDEVSTARTAYKCNSPESCSNYETPSSKSRSFFGKPSGSCFNDKKRNRMRKMVKALKRIVPGANRMSTVAVLDEAVCYLKSLRVEVQKLGVESLERA